MQNLFDTIMTQRDLFESMQPLLLIQNNIRKTGSAIISVEEKAVLRTIIKELKVATNPDIACASCVKSYLAIVESYYTREYPKFLKGTEGIQLEATDEDLLKAVIPLEQLPAELPTVKPKLSRAEICRVARAARRQSR